MREQHGILKKIVKKIFYFSFLYLVKKYDMDSPSSELN